MTLAAIAYFLFFAVSATATLSHAQPSNPASTVAHTQSTTTPSTAAQADTTTQSTAQAPSQGTITTPEAPASTEQIPTSTSVSAGRKLKVS
jgi:hypothetical protein